MSRAPLVDRIVCLSELSKDLEGSLRPVEAVREKCRPLRCVTLETLHQLDLRVSGHACDSSLGKLFDGQLNSLQLVHKYKDGERRGVHEGTFRWRGQAGVLATGTLQGITNAGTHREPAFAGCQRCDERGVMEGMLLGAIVRAEDPKLIGCEVRAAYRLRFDPSRDEGGSGGVRGTLEGALVCDCAGRPPDTCIDFSAFPVGAGPNPRVEQGVGFTVYDFAGAPAPGTQVRSRGTFTGLDVLNMTEITLPMPCAAVEVTLMTEAQPAQFEAFESGGGSAGAVSMTVGQQVAETLRLTGTAIDRAVITARANETLLLSLCFYPARQPGR
ncbi:hypothetical protein [Corallococcus aberystwythensis]|uniref:hypothetical protein n=1 Tax=Corallococcus aberystwythensis TaxID=2316722 RepID=UPI001ABF496F|nr:hypothetical protein [Corallococcus aberystwythensis]